MVLQVSIRHPLWHEQAKLFFALTCRSYLLLNFGTTTWGRSRIVYTLGEFLSHTHSLLTFQRTQQQCKALAEESVPSCGTSMAITHIHTRTNIHSHILWNTNFTHSFVYAYYFPCHFVTDYLLILLLLFLSLHITWFLLFLYISLGEIILRVLHVCCGSFQETARVHFTTCTHLPATNWPEVLTQPI